MDRRHFLTLTGAAGLAAVEFARPALAASYPFADAGVPDELHAKLGELAPYGVTTVAFTPSGGWVIVTQDGRYFARGVPDACFAELGKLLKSGAKIHCVAFPPEGGDRWLITSDKGMAARGLPEACHQRVSDSYTAGRPHRHRHGDLRQAQPLPGVGHRRPPLPTCGPVLPSLGGR
ncbi:hypothetical protein ACIBI9_39715 [Nonomuraea sp. NPDC050451]|uniref:hypothetical protein n=1 Tax=Nonomuraea sp. NPDC050451 TaxID=3364364 RepID=UPI003790A415